MLHCIPGQLTEEYCHLAFHSPGGGPPLAAVHLVLDVAQLIDVVHVRWDVWKHRGEQPARV